MVKYLIQGVFLMKGMFMIQKSKENVSLVKSSNKTSGNSLYSILLCSVFASIMLVGCDENPSQAGGTAIGGLSGAVAGATIARAVGGSGFAAGMSAIGLGMAGALVGNQIGKSLDKRAKEMAVLTAKSHKPQMWADDDGGEWVATPSKATYSNGQAMRVQIEKPNGEKVVVNVPNNGSVSNIDIDTSRNKTKVRMR